MTPSERAAIEARMDAARAAIEQLGIPAFRGSQYAVELAREVEPLIAAIPALLDRVTRLQVELKFISEAIRDEGGELELKAGVMFRLAERADAVARGER